MTQGLNAVPELTLPGSVTCIRYSISLQVMSHPVHSSSLELLRATVPLIGLEESAHAEGFDLSRVLFLDIDGVLRKESSPASAAFAANSILMEALEEADPDCRMAIVICSDWRLNHSLDALRSRLPTQVACRLVGVTSDLLHADGSRGDEVRAWMSEHAPQGQWMALDDRPKWYGNDQDRVFAVPSVSEGGAGILNAKLGVELSARISSFLARRPLLHP